MFLQNASDGCFCILCYVMLRILYLRSMHKIVYNEELINIDWLGLCSLQGTKCDPVMLLLLLQPIQARFKQQRPQQQQSTTQFQYETAPRWVDCISMIYNKFLHAYMTHTYATVNWDIKISYLWVLIRYTQHFE